MPSSLSVHPPLSIPALDAFQLHLTPFNSTPTFASCSSPESFRCGGSLISSSHVLSASHCYFSDGTTSNVGSFDFMRVKLGAWGDIDAPDALNVDVEEIIGNPRYVGATFENDITCVLCTRVSPTTHVFCFNTHSIASVSFRLTGELLSHGTTPTASCVSPPPWTSPCTRPCV